MNKQKIYIIKAEYEQHNEETGQSYGYYLQDSYIVHAHDQEGAQEAAETLLDTVPDRLYVEEATHNGALVQVSEGTIMRDSDYQ